MLQDAHQGEPLQVVVPQVEAGQIHAGEDVVWEVPQQVGVEEQQLEGRRGVKGPGFHLTDLIVLQVQVPEGGGALLGRHRQSMRGAWPLSTQAI